MLLEHHLNLNIILLLIAICCCVHLSSIYWLLKHWFYQNWQPVGKDEIGDEESSTHSPHQPQQVEGLQTGPFRHTGLASLDYFQFLIDRILCFLDKTSCVGEIQSR